MSLVSKLFETGKNISRKIRKNAMPLVFLGTAAVVSACGGGGGGGGSVPAPTISVKESVKYEITDSFGEAYFTSEDRLIKVTDQFGNPLSSKKVYLWDRDNTKGDGFEFVTVEDSLGDYITPPRIKQGISSNLSGIERSLDREIIPMFLGDELPVLKSHLVTSSDGQAILNLINKINEGGDYYYNTPEGLENSLTDLVTGTIQGPDGVNVYTFAANGLKTIVSQIAGWNSVEAYKVFNTIPNDQGFLINNVYTLIPHSDPSQICTDLDGDGYYAQSGCGTLVDCDDNPLTGFYTNPGAAEIFGNNKDDNCNGQKDEGFIVDNDNDGWLNTEDCNDSDEDVFPGAPELCDEKDNQCPGDVGYGQVDEGCNIPTIVRNLLFVSRIPGNDEVYKKQWFSDGTTNQIRVSYSDGGWSADPTIFNGKVLYVTTRYGSLEGLLNPQELEIRNLDGSNPTRISTNDFNDNQPAGSSDGNRIAFKSDRGLGDRIYTADKSGNNVSQLIPESEGLVSQQNPTWINNDELVFSAEKSGNPLLSLYKVNINTKQVTRITDDSVYAEHPSYYNGKIVFSWNLGSDKDLAIINSDGTGLQKLTNTPNRSEIDPKFSSNGKIAFGGSDFNVYEINSDGTGEVQLTTDGYNTNRDPIIFE